MVKPLTEFNKIWCEDRPHPYCKICHNKSSREYSYKKKFNLTIDDVYKILKKQKNKCAICQVGIKDSFHLDHNHTTNNVRGLLCRSCNLALGLFKDNIVFITNSLLYLYKDEKRKTNSKNNKR